MRKLLLGGAIGLVATGLRLAWEAVPPPGSDAPPTRPLGTSDAGVHRRSASLDRAPSVASAHKGQSPFTATAGWASCRSPPHRHDTSVATRG